ncbi:BTB/POZ and MATH domain-containing protein 2-like [Aegilops tauschii subsp. strangulata]|uniref:Protein roadkill n=1 Tax=Aegilops tauschii TaxID=37682 RepID=M8BG02_AEGTA
MTHNFEVTDFSLLEGAGAGSFAASSAFTVGGYEWELKLYPDGWKAEDKSAWVSIFLSLRKGEVGASGVKTRFTFSLLDQHGRASKLVSVDRSATSTFKSTGNYCGFDKFVDKSKLRRLLDLSKDSFTIKCVLTVVKEHRTKDVRTAIVVPLPQSSLHKHFLDMLKGGEGADVTFTVGSQSFLAHRCVLAID